MQQVFLSDLQSEGFDSSIFFFHPVILPGNVCSHGAFVQQVPRKEREREGESNKLKKNNNINAALFQCTPSSMQWATWVAMLKQDAFACTLKSPTHGAHDTHSAQWGTNVEDPQCACVVFSPSG